MFRDYDGNLGSFGDLSLPTTSSDVSKVAVYFSQDSSRPERYVMVAINRSTISQHVSFIGLAISGIARVYRLADTQTAPTLAGKMSVNFATWVVALPSLSVSTIEIIRDQ
jgi:hypothetical protein